MNNILDLFDIHVQQAQTVPIQVSTPQVDSPRLDPAQALMVQSNLVLNPIR